jgi:hypothetical protein
MNLLNEGSKQSSRFAVLCFACVSVSNFHLILVVLGRISRDSERKYISLLKFEHKNVRRFQ